MKQRICSQCVHGVCDPGFWVRQVALGCPATLMCVNTPEAPGQLRPVSPGGACRNFVVRRDPSYRLPPVEPATGDIRFIPLTQGKFAIVDTADYEWLGKYHWNAMTSDNTTYAFRKENGKVIFMHREIMKPRKGQVVDHINHNGADNRRSNMRNCSKRENACNGRARRNSSSQYRGVCRHGNGWSAEVGYLRAHVHVGSYAEEIEAARARDRMAIQLHGQYAYLNFPEEWPAAKREALYNSPEAVQARAEAKKRSARLLRAKRKSARRTAPATEGRKARGQEGKSRTRTKPKSQLRPDPNPQSCHCEERSDAATSIRASRPASSSQSQIINRKSKI
jgi:hypothetical protein